MTPMKPENLSDPPAPRRSTLRRLLLLVVPALLFVGIFAAILFRQADKPVPGGKAPEFSAPYLEEPGALSLSSLKGTPVVLNFWASWCEPCREESDLLQRASEDFDGKVAVVGIDTRDSRSDAVKFVNDLGLDYPQVFDEGERLYTRYGLTGQPESFFIDQNGIVVRHILGRIEADELYQYVGELVSRNA
jgi:cytochrome c biogenesis protein CcmG/thiol:disulfide interchange protein DsbE